MTIRVSLLLVTDELREPAQVVSRLLDDGSLSESLRRAALQEVMRERKLH